MKRFKTVTLLLFLSSFSFAYEKGEIDMHGGKGDSMLQNKGFSSNFQSLGTKKEMSKKEETKKESFIEVEKIEEIKEVKEKND